MNMKLGSSVVIGGSKDYQISSFQDLPMVLVQSTEFVRICTHFLLLFSLQQINHDFTWR